MPENKSGTTNKNQKAKETVNKAESVAKSTGTQKKTTAKASAAKEASSSAKKPASASKSSTTSKVSTKEKETKDVKATSKTQVNKEPKKSTINPTIESVDASNNTKEIKAKPASPKAEEAKEELKSVHEKQEKEAKKETVNKKSQTENGSNNRKKMISLLTAVGFLLLFGITITCILAVQSCSNSKDEYSNPYKTSTKVGYEAEVLGTVKRTIPTEEKNEGRSSVGYPKYGYTLKECIGTDPEKVEMRNAIIGESSYLTTVNTWNGGGGGYNRFDSEGYLYLNDQPTLDADGNPRKLYKHTASVGLYMGDVSDDEPGVIKRLTMQPRGYERGYSVTGLYAPAGELVKIEISKEDMEATGGLTVHIGQALYNGKANNIWAAKNAMNRFPVIMNTMNITKDLADYSEETNTYTAYVGSFVGGPVYIRNKSVPFTVTISGAVTYSHFILGYTTKEEFEENAKSSAPYFDLEVWEYGVLHSGPKTYAEPFSYDDIYDAAILWDKIALVSTQIRQQGIVFLYDPFVAAGAAVAFPGQGAVNCPAGWMSGSLNYRSFVNSGAWGNMHEFNHNFQGWGVGNGGEVTNNALNLVSYSLFTKISSARSIGSINEGLGGWNRYTSASWALREITEKRFSNGTRGLSIYATLLHNFGQEIFINAAKTSGGQSVDKFFMSSMNASHYDMTYYYKELLGYTVSDTTLAAARDTKYSMFVPAASIYQTGRSYTYDGEKHYTETMKPYVIPYGTDFTIDLNKCVFDSGNIYQGGSIVLPEGFSYKIKSVSQPENGSLTDLGDNNYKFTPNESIYSGKIYVTLEVTKDDGAFAVDDIELALEFEQSHEMNKTMLERTTYSYSSDKMYNSATEAYDAAYANYSDKVEGDNQNPILNGKVVQNGNAEVWFTEKPTTDQVIEIKGKLHIDEIGKYRLALRGRYNCALYASLDGKDYELAATYVQDKTSSPNFPNTEGTYKDYELEADTWLYFKAVLLVKLDSTKGTSFIGVGFGKFTPEAPIMDENGEVIGTIPESVRVSYASALREDYEFSTEKFESEYFYKRQYKYSYKNNRYFKDPATIVTSANYSPWDKNEHVLENLVDGDKNTWIHTNYTASPSKPLVIVVDLGKEITANQMTMFTQPRADYHCPVTFLLEGSLDGTTWFNMGSYEDLKVSNYSVVANFEETTFRYYRVNITKSSNRYIIISEIQFANIFELPNGIHISLDQEEVTLKGTWKAESILSSFGHSYTGKKNSVIEYEFEGTRFAVLSSAKLKHNFEVYIDGKKVTSEDLREDPNRIIMSFLSAELSEGKHKVRIVCTGTANIDSLLYW